MRNTIIFVCLIIFSLLYIPVYAGDIEPSAGPDDDSSAMYTIEDIYKLVLYRQKATKRTGAFTEPNEDNFKDGAPTGSSLSDDYTDDDFDEKLTISPSLDDLYELIRHYAPPQKATGNQTKVNLEALRDVGGGPLYPDESQVLYELGGIPPPEPRFTINVYGRDDWADSDCRTIASEWENFDENDDTFLIDRKLTDTDCFDDTVTDNMTSLEWARYGNVGLVCGLHLLTDDESEDRYNSEGATNLKTAWYTGLVSDCFIGGGNEFHEDGTPKENKERWRIPSSMEFVSIFDYAYFYPALSNTKGSPYDYDNLDLEPLPEGVEYPPDEDDYPIDTWTNGQWIDGDPWIGLILDNHYTNKKGDSHWWTIERIEDSDNNRFESHIVRVADGTTDADDNYWTSIYIYDQRHLWLVRGGQEGDWNDEWLMSTYNLTPTD
jgi:hypothetical protein